LSNSPEIMALLSAGVGVTSVVLGLSISLHVDTPSGPSIVAAAFCMFIIIHFAASMLKYRKNKV